MRAFSDLAHLLSRGAALSDLARLSAEGMAHGECLPAAESLALHVKALDLMSAGLSYAQTLSAHAARHAGTTAGLPPHLHPSLADAVARSDEVRARFGQLLKSAERVRAGLAVQRGASASSSAADGTSSSEPSSASSGAASSGAAASGGGAEPERGSGSGSAPAAAAASQTVCVEELLYRQALSMGREAAVDELLGKYDDATSLYSAAKLILEQLSLEPMVGEADRAVLSKYAAGFSWRLEEIAAKQNGTFPHRRARAHSVSMSPPAAVAEAAAAAGGGGRPRAHTVSGAPPALAKYEERTSEEVESRLDGP